MPRLRMVPCTYVHVWSFWNHLVGIGMLLQPKLIKVKQQQDVHAQHVLMLMVTRCVFLFLFCFCFVFFFRSSLVCSFCSFCSFDLLCCPCVFHLTCGFIIFYSSFYLFYLSFPQTTIVTGGGVRIFAFQHADDSSDGDGFCTALEKILTTKSRTVTLMFMFALMFVYFCLTKDESLRCLNGVVSTDASESESGGGGGVIDLSCTEEVVEWAKKIEIAKTIVLVLALAFFMAAAVMKTMKAARGRRVKWQ